LQALQKERETLEALRPELTEGTNIYILKKKKLRYSLVPLFVKPFGGFQGYKKAKNKSKSEMFFFRPPA
jgi:hypothetical protein